MIEAELMIEARDAGRDAVRTLCSATVVSWDHATATASVRLDVGYWWRDSRGDWREGQQAPLEGIPVAMIETGGRGIVWGLVPGDRVTVAVRERSHADVDAGASVPVVPTSRRRFSLSDAIVLPFASARRMVPSSRLDGQPVFVLPGGEALHVGDGTADRALALAEETRTELQQLRAGLVEHVHTATSFGVATTPAQDATAYPTPLEATQPSVGEIATARVLVDG